MSNLTEQETEYILTNYKYMTVREMSIAMSRSRSGIMSVLRRFGVIGEKRAHGKTGYFPKGHIPHNKGVNKCTSEKCIPTQFKKGQKPLNARKEGEVWMKCNGQGPNRYFDYFTKVNGRIIPMRVKVWQEHNGEVPQGHIVIYKGERLNYNIDNLECISRAENARRNHNKEVVKAQYATNIAYTREYAASRMAYNNRELRWELLKHPELLDIKIVQYKLGKSLCKRKSQTS